MKKYIQHIVLLTSLMLATALSFAQKDVSVSASVNKNEILIGEPIELELEAIIPPGTPPVWFSVDSLHHFEFIDKGKIDTAAGNVYKQTLTITSFDSGVNVIPPISLDVNGRFYLTDSIPVTVSFSEFDAKKDYHDIKDILEVAPLKEGYLKWILVGAGALVLFLIAWLLRKKFRKKAVPAAVALTNLSPYEEALKALETLREQPLGEKQFYTGLNDIIRWFVYRKAGIITMQKTNEEFILQLDKLRMAHEDFVSLSQTLRMADAVKFAKYVPPENEREQSYQSIRKSIEKLNNITNSAV